MVIALHGVGEIEIRTGKQLSRPDRRRRPDMEVRREKASVVFSIR